MESAELRAMLGPITDSEGLGEGQITITAEQATKLKEFVSGQSTEIAALESQLQKAMVRGEAVTALTKAGGNVKMLMPHVQSAARVRKNDQGQREVEITNGNVPRLNLQGKPMTIEDYVAELKGDPVFSGCFDMAQGGGPAAPRNDMRALGNNIEAIASGEATVNITGKQARNVRAYRFAKAEAEKLGVSLRIVD